MDIGKNYISERAVKPWNRMLREVVETPSLQVFKSCVDVTLGDVVQWCLILAYGQILKSDDAIVLNDTMKYLEFQLG